MIRALLMLVALSASASMAFAADSPNPPASASKPDESAKPEPGKLLPGDAVTRHTIQVGGIALNYMATAGTIPLFGDKENVTAKVFYTAYRLDGGGPRPITFVFNGGPGAAAAFLHLGGLGPRIVPFTSNGAAAVQPVQLADNPDTWLDFTDLVFIDPVATGFSRSAAGGADGEKPFLGVDKDADVLASFIQLYLTRNGLDFAPVYIAGESYGGFRAPLVANRLLRAGVQVRGLTLVSPALEYVMLRGDDFLVTPLVLKLPSIAATHAELKDGPDGPLDALREAEVFALGGYLTQLASGEKPSDAMLDTLSRLTGLDRKIIARHNGRVSPSLFRREYKRATDRSLSVYDGTVSAPIPRPGDDTQYDPVLDGAASVLGPAAVHYFREELSFKTDMPYKLLNRDVIRNWDFGTTPNRQGYAGAIGDLQKARTVNPDLRVFIAHGYTDLLTTYSTSKFLVSQLEPIDGATAVSVKAYRGGHMMYLRPASRGALKRDAAEMYKEGAAAGR